MHQPEPKRRALTARRVDRLALSAAVALLAAAPAPARAESVNLGPGGTLDLSADRVLDPTDTFIAEGTADNPCIITGNGFQIVAMDFEGIASIAHCQLLDLGNESKPAIDFRLVKSGSFSLSDSEAHASGTFAVTANDTATLAIRRTTFAADGAVFPAVDDATGDGRAPFGTATPAVSLGGTSSATKYFQGNSVLRSYLHLGNTRGWQIGGLNDQDGNIFFGPRTVIHAEEANDLVIQGNYVRTPYPWDLQNELSSIWFASAGQNILVEHNVLRGANGILVGGASGEIRYNLLADPHAQSWLGPIDETADVRFHHNLLVRSEASEPGANYWQMDGLIVLHVAPAAPAPEPKLEFFNNTVDSADCYNPPGAGIALMPGAIIKSVRNNVFMRMEYAAAGVAPFKSLNQFGAIDDPGPVGMGYADYNAFSNLHAPKPDNYAVSVAGKTERVDTGFGAHDLGNPDLKNQQVADVKLAGPLPRVFPFSDDDLSTRHVTVCQVLAFYRKLYQPTAQSPLVGAADPADAPAGITDIGAIGAGAGGGGDLFGLGCPADISAIPPVPSKDLACTVTVSGPGGMPTTPPGWLCVCATSAGGAVDPLTLLPILGGAAAAIHRRRRRRPVETVAKRY